MSLSVFYGSVHFTGGISFSGIALNTTGDAQVRLYSLPAVQLLLATRKRASILAFRCEKGGFCGGFPSGESYGANDGRRIA